MPGSGHSGLHAEVLTGTGRSGENTCRTPDAVLVFSAVEPPESPAPLDRSMALAASVRTLSDWWLETRCGCQACSMIPLRMMVASGFGARSLADVLLKLRCRSCGRRPVGVDLLEHGNSAPAILAYGGRPPWRVALLERSAADAGGPAGRPLTPEGDIRICLCHTDQVKVIADDMAQIQVGTWPRLHSRRMSAPSAA
jgi:hypothetical protein